MVGDDCAAAHVHRAVVVHLPYQPAAEVDGADLALEGTGEHALDHTLYVSLEGLQAHGHEGTGAAVGRLGSR